VWILSIAAATAAAADDAVDKGSGSSAIEQALVWTKRDDLQLPVGRCAHGAAVVGDELCIFGGFTADGGIDGSLQTISLNKKTEGRRWEVCSLEKAAAPSAAAKSKSGAKTGSKGGGPPKSAGGSSSSTNVPGARFGLSMCSVTHEFVRHYHNPHTAPVEPELALQPTTGEAAAESSPESNVSHFTASCGSPQYSSGGALIFGGVSVENDFGDVWLLYPV
jgi:hypothetical protein